MSAKIYLTILRSGIYLAFLSVFLVFNNLLFPFITSKQIYFNILVEILVVFWLALLIKYPEYRPKKSWITIGLIAFFAAMLISCFTGVDFNLSFWGDVERMLGFFHILHFLAFYFIIITVFRSPGDWRNLFIVSVVAALLVSFNSLFKTAFSTIGNTSYVSGYVIFNLYFALLLYFNWREEQPKLKANWLFGLIFVAVSLILISVMKMTHTRGAYAALAFSLAILFLLLGVLNKNKKIKILSLVSTGLIILLFILVFSFANSNLVKNNTVLNTITQISSKTVTFQTRLISWKTAWQDFTHHPIFGTGLGNFSITFDKYFNPKFYNYTTSETYFDRAHNNLIEIASTAGLAGLLTYLAIFVAVFYYLFKGLKTGLIKTYQFILLSCLIIAYFVQNLAVFDSLVTYISLMVMLAYIYFLSQPPAATEEQEAKTLDSQEVISLAVAGLVAVLIIFQFNLKPYWMLDGTIAGQMALAQGEVVKGIEEYKKALAYNTILDRDSRSSLINSVAANSFVLTRIDLARAKEILDYVIKQAEANVKYNPADSMMQMQLAMILNTASVFYTDDLTKFYFYSDRALEAINKSIAASPGRVTIYFSKTQIYIMRGEKEKAIETLK